jgi:5'-3' exonuclease
MRLLIVDGHYYAYRSYFAIKGLKNSSGKATNALFGFAKAIQRMLQELKPDYRLVIWDGGLSTERVALVSQYKSQRAEMPDSLREQMDDLVELTKALGFASICMDGVEADDLIASYAIAASKEKIETIIATNDKDLYQLVSDQIFIYSPQKEGFALQGREDVIKKWGVPPESLALVLALMGDASDNIPGVPGIGPKTAAAWVQQYQSLENIDRHLMDIGTDTQRSALAAAWEQVKKNYSMVQLHSTMPLPIKLNQLQIAPNYNRQIDLFNQWEFKTMKAKAENDLNKNKRPQIDNIQGRFDF